MTSDEKDLDPVEAAFYYGADGVPSYIAGYTQGRADAIKQFYDEISCNQVYAAKKSRTPCVVMDSITEIKNKLLPTEAK